MSTTPRPYRSRDGSKLDRIVEAIRRDPELETWQIRERFGGVSGSVVDRARQIAGVPAPEPWQRRRSRG